MPSYCFPNIVCIYIYNFKISSLMDFCAMDVSEMWKGYVDGVEIIAGKASFPAAWDRTGSGAASEESKASLLESAISSQDCLKDYLTKVHRLTSRKRNKRYGRMATSDVLPVSLMPRSWNRVLQHF